MAVTGTVKSGDYGTQVLTAGTATTVTLIDLSGVVAAGEFAIFHAHAQHQSTVARNVVFWKDAGGTENVHGILSLSAGITAQTREQNKTFAYRVITPGAALYYSWGGSVTSGGLDVWVVKILTGLPLAA